MRYYVHVSFSGPTDIADPSFLAALDAAGLLRLGPASEGLSFDLVSPSSISASASGHWAGRLCEQLRELRTDWAVTVDRDAAEVD